MTDEDREPPTVDVADGSRSSVSSRVDPVHPVDPADPADPTDEPTRSGRRGRPPMPVWQESLLLLVGAVVLAVVIKALFLQAFYIPSESMEPGLVKNDRIVVEKPSYWFGGVPARGDVVVFKDPGGWLGPEESRTGSSPLAQLLTRVGLYPAGGHLVKRVVGVPGDVVECCDAEGRLLVDGKPVEESTYARPRDGGCAPGSAGVCYGPMPGVGHWKTQRVPEGMLFVMGDNRAHSADSSYHLCTPRETECSDSPWVPADLVVGKVAAVVWPLDKLRLEHRPEGLAEASR